MENQSLNEIEKEYDLEIKRVIDTINKEKAKKVLLQFPDGLKPHSTVIADEIEKHTNALCFIWLSTCFGACDVPIEVEKLGVDLIVQFGHSGWKYNNKKIKIL